LKPSSSVKWIEGEFPELRQLIPWVKQYVLDEGLKEPQWFDLRLHLRAIIHGIIHEQRIHKTLGLLFAEGINALRADRTRGSGIFFQASPRSRS
jgi:hypothetical protein